MRSRAASDGEPRPGYGPAGWPEPRRLTETSMSFLSRVMRFLFWLLVLSWSVALLRRAVAWMLRGGATAAQQNGVDASTSNQDAGIARRLVRDPVCGVHMAEVLAIPLREGGEIVHFCSVECRDKYVASTKKLAANA
jgi:hypothetical protein